ncbi:reverse transcriptase domain-containing protein [Tanacetum coccineum]
MELSSRSVPPPPSSICPIVGTVFREPPYPFDYPMWRLTMEEILAKFIDEGRHEHEEMEIFIKEFRTTNELLLKTQSNLLSELKIEVNELSKVVSNVLIPKNKVKGVTTRGGKMTSKATHSKKINETGINKNEPPRFEQDVQEKLHNDCVENKSSSILERTTQPLVKPQQSSIPFLNRVRKEKEEALQQIFLENLKQLDINISFIEALVLSCLAQRTTIKRKRPRSFTTLCQVFEKAKEAEDLAADHLSRFQKPHMEVLTKREIADKFSDKHLMVLKSKFINDEPWKEAYAFKLFADNIMRRCVAGSETLKILAHCHSGPTSGHHSANVTTKKVYESGFYWPSVFKDANEYVRRCDACQRPGNISSRNEMPQNNIQVCEVFDVWGLDFMGPFPESRGNKYILVVVDYVSKWVEAQALPMNDARVVVKFLRQLFARFGVPKALLNELAELRDGAYENTRIYKEQTKKWHDSRLLCGDKILKRLASESHLMQLNELAELRDGAYENTRIYKEQTKKWHDSRLRGDKDFKVGDKVLLYNSRLKMYPRKIKSKWSGPNIVKMVYPHGAIEITDRDGVSLKVNGQRLKKYYRGNIDKEDDEDLLKEIDNVGELSANLEFLLINSTWKIYQAKYQGSFSI